MTTPQGRAAAAREKEVISPWEWVIGAFGLLLVLFALGVMIHEAMGPTRPPVLVTRVDSIAALRAGYRAHVSVANSGGEAASSVVVEGELASPAGDTTRRQITFEQLPPGATRTGGLFFDADPRAGTLTVRALGYARP